MSDTVQKNRKIQKNIISSNKNHIHDEDEMSIRNYVGPGFKKHTGMDINSRLTLIRIRAVYDKFT